MIVDNFDEFDEFDFNQLWEDALAEDKLSPEKSLALLKKIYVQPSPNNYNRINNLESILSYELPSIMSTISVQDPLMLRRFNQLSNMTTAALEQSRLPMLRGRSVIGVGGAFSAGKSRFLNSLMGIDHLPENQGPTTAIATYILRGKYSSIQAYTKYGHLVNLDPEELKLITHEFYDRYKIGFAGILHKIIVTTRVNSYISNDIVLLDTPGYNKPDESQSDEIALDNRIARRHLLGCNYIIWLISADSGTINKSDIDFLRNLQINTACLFIVNKADMKTDNELRDILSNIIEILTSENIQYFGVTAYSSAEKREWFGNNLLNQFIENAAKARQYHDCINELNIIQDEWGYAFNEHMKKLDNLLMNIKNTVCESDDINFVKGLIRNYHLIKRASTAVYHNENNFHMKIKKVQNNLKNLFDRNQFQS